MLSEKELRFLIKKKLMLKEGLLQGSTAYKHAGVTTTPPAGGSSGGSGGSGPGGGTSPSIGGAGGRLPSGGASVTFISTALDDTASVGLNDEADLGKLAIKLDIPRLPVDATAAVQQEEAFQAQIVAKIMELINKNEESQKGAKEIFGENIEERINQYYTKKITTKDIFGASEPNVKVNIQDYTSGGATASNNQVRYNPTTQANATWSSGNPVQLNNNFPYYWLEFMVDRDFQIKGGSSVNFNSATGYPEFDISNQENFNTETTELYSDEYALFQSQYKKYIDNYYQLRSDLLQYFDDEEALAYVHLLHDLISKDTDQENLPMTRMFFATISAEAYTGYAGGDGDDEVKGMFAVGEDHRIRSYFTSGFQIDTVKDKVGDGTIFPGGDDGIVDAAAHYSIPWDHCKDMGDVRVFTDKKQIVKKAQQNLRKTIRGILERKMDGPTAIANLRYRPSIHGKAFKDEFNNETTPYLKASEAAALEALEENRLRKLINSYLLTEKKTMKNVGLDAEFESMTDSIGYVFVHFGSSISTVTPSVYYDTTTTATVPPEGGPPGYPIVRAPDLYRLAYYSINWDNPPPGAPEGGNIDALFSNKNIFKQFMLMYKAASLEPGGFDLNAVAVFKASSLMIIGKQLQAGTDPYGIKTSGATTDPKVTAPTPAEVSAYQVKLVGEPFCMEAMRVKEVSNAIFDGIRRKDTGYKKFLQYLEANKKKIMLGKNLDKTYEAALEGGMEPDIPVQQKRDKESISKMYEYFASMKQFSSGDKQDLLAERDAALKADGGRGKMELGTLKTDHPMFSKALLILMQQKIKSGGKISYDDMLRLSDDFKNTASVFNLSASIGGLYELFINLKTSRDVDSKNKIKVAAAAGAEIKYDQAFGSAPADIIISASGSGIPGGTVFDPSKSESAMSEFSSLLKDSDNTLNQEVTITLGYRKGKVRRVKKIEDRLGGNIKIGLRRWINKDLMPSITPPSTGSGDIVIKFPPGRYIGKGLSESDISKELIKLIKEYSS